jgi:glucose/mannose-6-phosphate isomerase
MKILDNKKEIIKLQGDEKVITSIYNLDKQINDSFNQAKKTQFPKKYKEIENIVVGGMGGSRFPALIIKELFKKEFSKPIIINDNYQLPGFINGKTLFIASSYSGTTEEVLIMLEQAKNKKALISGITAGGDLAKKLTDIKAPFYQFNPIFNPSGQPRIGFGYAVGGMLGLLMSLGVLKIKKEEVEKAISFLTKVIKNFSIETLFEKNEAKKLAFSLFEKYPFYIVSEFLTGVGNAVANQTNETAKAISDFRIIPELNHHLMEGLKHPQILKKILVFVFFESDLYSDSIKKRFKITKEVVEKNKAATLTYQLSGKTKIEQVFEMMALGSFLSMYLSVLYKENPATIPYVDYFKKRLKEVYTTPL